MLPGLVAYSVLSTYVVSASLQPGRTCSSDGGPPLDLNAEAVTFSSRTDGIALAGWLVSTERDRAVILIHGIDSDAWAGAAPDLAGAYAGAGFDVLLFDLRAHGRSGGERVGLGSLERATCGQPSISSSGVAFRPGASAFMARRTGRPWHSSRQPRSRRSEP